MEHTVHYEGQNRGYQKKGVWLATIGACFWGLSGTCSQALMHDYGLEPLFLSSIRLIVTGLILFVYLLFRSRPLLFDIWKRPRDVLTLCVFAIFGLLGNQAFYLKSIQVINAGISTVLQYTAPAMVMVWACLRRRSWPKWTELIALGLTLFGTLIIATHLTFGQLSIPFDGLLFGIISAFFLMIYNVVPSSIIVRYGALVITCWGMLIGGVFEWILIGGFRYSLSLDTIGYGILATNILFGTLLSYCLYLQGIRFVGALKASMISCIEPVSATIFSAFFLHTYFTIYDVIGCACILATVIMIAMSGHRASKDIKTK